MSNAGPLEIELLNDHNLRWGNGFFLNFQRTLRIPDDGKTYPLPPGLGTFPVCRVEDYEDRVPDAWNEHAGIFIPMYQREALWISFRPRYWRPNAVKVGIGMINAVSGKGWDQALCRDEEDYLVCPPQPWLDGINAGDGYIRQFIAMPLGMGYTVEAQVTGEEKFGGIQIIVYEPKPGRFPEEPPEYDRLPASSPFDGDIMFSVCEGGVEMGIGSGGRMKQKIYPDPHGVDTWDQENYGRIFVHIVNSMMYREITGKEPPPTPITARTYTQYGLPWFDLYDEDLEDIKAPEVFKKIKSIKEMDQEKGFSPQQDDLPLEVPGGKIIKCGIGKGKVKDGKW